LQHTVLQNYGAFEGQGLAWKMAEAAFFSSSVWSILSVLTRS